MIRDANLTDVPAIAVLAQQKRLQYAAYQPQFWNLAPDAEERHRPWLERMVGDDAVLVLVDEDEVRDEIRGYLFATIGRTPPVYDAGGDTASIDDFFVVPAGAWATRGRALFDAASLLLRERGAAQVVVVCAQLDICKRTALAEAGLTVASEWWVRDIRFDASAEQDSK